MKIVKKILIVLLIIFILMQFIRPEKNTSAATGKNDIATKYTISLVCTNSTRRLVAQQSHWISGK